MPQFFQTLISICDTEINWGWFSHSVQSNSTDCVLSIQWLFKEHFRKSTVISGEKFWQHCTKSIHSRCWTDNMEDIGGLRVTTLSSSGRTDLYGSSVYTILAHTEDTLGLLGWITAPADTDMDVEVLHCLKLTAPCSRGRHPRSYFKHRCGTSASGCARQYARDRGVGWSGHYPVEAGGSISQ